MDFEQTSPGAYTASNAVSGWTISSNNSTLWAWAPPPCVIGSGWVPGATEFSVLSTPLIPANYSVTGVLGHSPLGGAHIVQLNDTNTNNSVTRLTRNYFVGSPNTSISFAFAGYWEDGQAGHSCCDSPGLNISIKDSSGNVLPCKSISIFPGSGCSSYGITFTVSYIATWSNWQVKTFDLSPYVNSQITIEVISKDCGFGDHYGLSYFDCSINTTQSPVLFCPGSNLAIINGPPGEYYYQWYLPSWPFTGSTQPTIAIANPVAGTSYTLVYGACTSNTVVYTLAHSSVSILNINSSPTCSSGTNGSATITANGSNVGYTYSWTNSTNSVISTSSVVSGLSPGIYSVNVSATGNSSCGVAGGTVNIATTTVQPTKLRPQLFCGSTAYFNISNASNCQWYSQTGAITSSLGGTSSSYTATNITSASLYFASFINSQGCKDSTLYYCVPISPGSITVAYNPSVCANSTAAVIILSVTTSPAAPTGSTVLFAKSISTLNSTYSLSQGPASSPTFSLNNLPAGTSYSVNVFDGQCSYSSTFSVKTFSFNFGISVTPTICSQTSKPLQIVNFSPSAQTAQISPTIFLQGSAQLNNLSVNAPSLFLGASTQVIYTITITPTVINCPLSKTVSIKY